MSKEEAIEILSDMRCECNLFGDEEEATRYHALSWAINAMNTEPKHGWWKNVHISLVDPDGVARYGRYGYQCSICRTETADITPYCPNCGAKMDGGENE